MNNIKLSICCITYNHEKFIAQAIEGFLMQKTNFDFEIVIGEDYSKDTTRKICEEYFLKYPQKIKLLPSEKNWGMIPNFIRTYENCRSSYIAFCEGDDYWTDPYKLQKQVDFLEKNIEYVGCFHNTEERYIDDENKASFLYCKFSNSKSLTFQDLTFKNIIPTCSVVFRNKLFENLPDWYKILNLGDWTLHLINAQYGNFWYMPQVMAVHHLHSKSVWMLQDTEKNKQYVKDAYQVMIDSSYFDSNKTFLLKKAFDKFNQSDSVKNKLKLFLIKLAKKAKTFIINV